ncbi:MAG: 4-oxalomesaconate tautomerase [Pseudomonadota bacterium]
MTQRGVPCTMLRGGTSRGLYFLAQDLPPEPALRDRVLARAMGSPDERQIDGVGGAHPLTSKVAVIGPATRPDAEVDYLFLQVSPDTGLVSDAQNCGNILAGVAGFAIEQGLVDARDGETQVRIHMVNSGSLSIATVQTPAGVVTYEGNARIDGVPGMAAPVMLSFEETEGANCGALLPTGAAQNEVLGVPVTAIDNGMPVVVLRAADLGQSGRESPAELEADAALREKLEAIRRELGPRMNLGDVATKTVPKMCLISPPERGGAVNTRTFIPHRVHEAVGVLGAVSVATACLIPGSTADGIAEVAGGNPLVEVEHPTGSFAVELDIEVGEAIQVRRSALLRTARKVMSGEVFVPASLWASAA